MPVQRDASGHRYVQAEVEVPGTPEDVWRAIATGPGISCWFVPTEVDERVGGKQTANFGPGMDSLSTITEWEPPRRFVAESRDDMGPDDPTIATEWTVEARSGGTCVVRVVHRWFTEKDDWDEQFEGHSYGWLAFFRILKAYATHFSGERCASFQLMGVAPEPKETAWAAFTRPLGLDGVAVGERVSTANSDGAPALAGTIESVAATPEWPELLIKLDTPAPGIVHIVPHSMTGQVYLTTRFYLYGDQAAAAAEKAKPAWQAWVNQRFAPAGAEA
jgi:uncharacterized protein YndB with AHSA1/START domain